MKCFIVLFGVTLLWRSAVSQQCQTPLGRTSNCISLYQCPSLVAVFEQNPLPYELVAFLRQSQCGFAGNVPKVCCGPLPNQQTATTTQRSQVTPRPQFNGQADPVSSEDSAPYPRKQCGIDTNGDRIYGGVDTELDEFPWMALLGYQPRDSSKPLTYQCGGVLINRRYVMSAAHCVVGEIENVVGKLTSARLGEYDIKNNQDCLNGVCAEPVQEIAVMSAHPHPGYSDKNTNRRDDISLIRLARRATLTYYIQPICLVDTSLRIEPGTDVFVAGWGKTLSGKSSQVKQKLNLPVFSKHECVAKYRDLGADITDKQLCAGGNFAEDACRGDSGGPLMRRTPSGQWEAVAVVSFGYGCGRDGWPGIYTAVQGYIDWIQNTLRSTNV
ncbi:phenoloxidase-activating enzyme 1-like [Aricia agestis]|uniref:phenoloxidase-activating enzyme 1-like n=1 Tax=Aricia agestis TaxID=91739 RepID=UPI001C20275E|nr:phenoloxidase-activating enzyme 1-like [Aricia agestis]